MKPKSDFDPDFDPHFASPPRPRATLGRSHWLLMWTWFGGILTLMVLVSPRSHPAPLRTTMPFLRDRGSHCSPATRSRPSARSDEFADRAITSSRWRARALTRRWCMPHPKGIDDAMVVPAQGRAARA